MPISTASSPRCSRNGARSNRATSRRSTHRSRRAKGNRNTPHPQISRPDDVHLQPSPARGEGNAVCCTNEKCLAVCATDLPSPLVVGEGGELRDQRSERVRG